MQKIQNNDDCLIYSATQRPDIAIEDLQVCLENLENSCRMTRIKYFGMHPKQSS